MKSTLERAAMATPVLAALMLLAPGALAEPPAPSSTSAATATDEQVTTETKTTKTKKAKPAKAKTEAAKKAEKETKAKSDKAKKDAEKKGDSVAEEAHESATKANENIVGEDTQAENERRAREKRDREAKDEADAKKAGEKVGRATTTAATAVVDAAQDVTRTTDAPGQYSPLVASWNPLGAIVGGRVSFNVEYAPVTHHVIIVSPHFANPSQDVMLTPGTTHTNRFTGVGTEAGYRYYTGHRGPNGVFLGSTLIGGVYNADLAQGNKAFTNIGIAADVGFQVIVWDHLALGAGAGIEYLHVSQDFGDLSAGPSTIASSGVKPRLLAQAGYAF